MLTTKAANNTRRVVLRRLHPGQVEIKRGIKRFNVLCCGRRFGKNILLQDIAAHAAIKGKPIAWYAPTFRMLLDDWRELKRILGDIAKPNEQERRLELITGGVVEMWSLDSGESSRGKKYSLAIINEAAMVKELDYIWPAVIRPTLADLGGLPLGLFVLPF